MSRRLPYPGLRRFQPSETDLFFGRNKESSTIVKLLTANRFLGVLGASGSGKSSLVFTRLIQALEGGANTVGSAWQIADFRPKGEPIANLAKALVKASNPSAEAQSPETVAERLRASPRAIVQWCEDGNLAPGHALLIIADQFEELFNYNTREARDEAHALASLLVESAHSREAPIYVVLTMRSDYFGHCSAFPQLAQAISDSIFLTPRMLRDQCKLAIEGPAGVSGFTIRKDLLIRLLNDLERLATFDPAAAPGGAQAMPQADQLPLLQYALNSMWRRVEPDVPANEDVVLKLEHYVGDGGIGGIEGALDNQGKATLEMLAAVGVPQEQVERVFRALVKGSDVSSAVRDPHRIRRVARIAGLDIATVTSIVSAFAADDCQFLDLAQPVDDASFVDISHESLIRQWGLLRGWLTREAEAAETWRSLARDATDWRRSSDDPEALLRGAQLADRNTWWRDERPTDAWVERYPVEDKDGKPVPGEVVGKYLDAGIAARDAVRDEARKRQRRRTMLGAVTVLSLVTGISGIAYSQRIAAQAEMKNALTQAELARAQMKVARSNKDFAERLGGINKKLRDALSEAEGGRAEANAAKRRAIASALDARQQARLAAVEADKSRRANQAIYDGATKMVARMEGEQEEVGRSAKSRGNAANDYLQVLFRDEAQPQPQFVEVGRRFDLVLVKAALNVVGFAQPEEVNQYAASIAKGLRVPGALVQHIAQGWLIEGQADELVQNYDGAIEAYGEAFKTAPDETAAKFDAAAAMVRLRRLGHEGPALDNAVAWCAAIPVSEGTDFLQADEPGKLGDGAYARIAGLRCRAEVAGLWQDQGRKEEAAPLLAELRAINWPKEANKAERAENILSRLQLRTQIALLTGTVDDPLLQRVKTHFDANRDTEPAAAMYAALLEANDDAEGAYLIRRPLLENAEATTGFLLASLRGLEQRDGESADVDQDNTVPTVQSIKESIDSVGSTVRLIDVVQRLENRGAPRPIGAPDRPKLLADGPGRLKQRLENALSLLKRFAHWNRLLDDLETDASTGGDGAHSTHLTPLDQHHIGIFEQLLSLHDAACKAGELNQDCMASLSLVREEVGPLLARVGEVDLLLSLDAEESFPLRVAAPKERDQYRLGGYDLGAYFRQPANSNAFLTSVRGRESIQLPDSRNRKFFLFASDENLAAFDRSRLAYDGYAADWMAVGERVLADPRLACLIGGRLFLFDLEESRAEWCPIDGSSSNPAIAAADRSESGAIIDRRLKGEDLDPLPGVAYEGLGLSRRYILEKMEQPVAPAACRVRRVGNEVRLTFADGSTASMRVLGSAGFSGGPPLVAKGAPIPLNYRGKGNAMLIWRFTPAK